MLTVFFASRALFMVAGALAVVLLPEARPAGTPLEPPGFLSYWANWDGAWYAELATEGYGARAPASTVFFPLYPLVVGLGSSLTGGVALWGVAVSLVCTLFFLFFLYRITETLYDGRVARAATLCAAFFPTAFFLNAVYTEAMFLALTSGALWAALVRRDLLLAGAFGAFAAATRNLGVLLLLPLGYEWLRSRREFGGRGLAELSLVPAGLVAYAIYLGGRFGSPLIFTAQQQEYWGRTLASPLQTLQGAWTAGAGAAGYLLEPAALFLSRSPAPTLEFSNTLNLLFLALFIAVMGAGVFVLPPTLSAYSLIMVLLPLLTPSPQFPLMSLPRFMLAAFPVFMVMGWLLARSRGAMMAWLAFSALGGVVLTALFVTWRWVA